MLVALVLIPYIIGHIGIERYGMWAIVGVLTGYFGLLDFGIGTSFVKYIAEYYTKKDYKKINQVINTGFVFYSVFAVLIITLGLSIIKPLLNFFNIPQELYNEAVFVFLIGIILFGVSNALCVFEAIQGGLQRMDISNKVAIAMSIPNIIGTVFFLESGYGLPGLIVNNAIIFFISSMVNIIIAFKILPELRLNPSFFSKEAFKRLFGFGYKLQTAKIADIIAFQTDRLLIAHFLNISLVGFYQIGSSVAQHMRQIPLLLISAILPAASEIDAKQEQEKLRELYIKGSKYLIFVSFPIVFFVISTAHLIMLIWMGNGYEKSAWIIQILAIGYFVNLVSGVGVSMSAAIGKPEFQMKAAIITVVSNIILSVVLIIAIGFIGVAIATTVSLILGPVYFFIKLHSHLRLSLKNFVREIVVVPFIASIIPTMLIYGLNSGIKIANLSSSRLINLSIFAFSGILFIVIYLALILRNRYLDKYDIDLLKRHFAFGELNLLKMRVEAASLNQLIRYMPIVYFIKRETCGKILEIGSGLRWINAYLPDKIIFAVDINFSNIENLKKERFYPIKGSAKHLPFKDNSFPIVVCVDTLEHISLEDRESVIKELCRVGSNKIYLSFPVSESYEKWEQKLLKVYKLWKKDIPDWLREHIDKGLPKEENITKFLKENKIAFKIIPNENNFIHFIIMIIDSSCFSKYLNYIIGIISPETWKKDEHSFKVNLIRSFFVHFKRLTRFFNFGSTVRKIFILTKNESR